jgi:DNA relaxase NicK
VVCEIVDIGVDYLRVTSPEGTSAIELGNIGNRLFHVEHSVTREEGKDASINGYRGYQCGRVFVGERGDGVMLQASSGAASGVAIALQEFGGQLRCPRIDIQVTGRFDFDHYYYAQQATQKARAACHGKSSGRPVRVHLDDGGDRGSTCSIGSRTSARFIRIYDKTREQVGRCEENLWRWEVEYKKPLSLDVMQSILGNCLEEQYIAAQVYAELDRLGVTPPWESLERTGIARLPSRMTSVERNLNWLRTVVAPMLRRLDNGGYTEEYMSALGLTVPVENDSMGLPRKVYGV